MTANVPQFLFVSIALLTTGCGRTPQPATAPSAPVAAVGLAVGNSAPAELPGLHNVFRLTERLYSGSVPEGDAGFESLRRLGVQTVISVDGARPDVDRAHRHGMRYVHLPIGYDGVPAAQALRLARAVRDLDGPVYMHCHHGKHRGPAAAAAVHRCLDATCDAEAAVAELRRAGTDPRYAGLYASVRELKPPTPTELDTAPADFPDVADTGDLVKAMVAVDEHADNLKLARAAGWKTPPGHPDVDPAHEAVLLAELYREAGRLPDVAKRGEDFRRRLANAEDGTKRLEAVLRTENEHRAVVIEAANAAWKTVEHACTSCHERFRDIRQRN
jgi:protein tyrosine phosphatase (PTP) superfamily phosphohydrolase (DUF442 family)